MSIGTDDLGRISKETTVLSADGDRLGTVEQVYTSDTSGDPAWVTLATGSHGAQESFVPLADASFDGFNIKTRVSRDAVDGAPRVDAGGHLGIEEEDDLYRYYGIDNPDHTENEVADEVVGTQPAEADPEDRAGQAGGTDQGDTRPPSEDPVPTAVAEPDRDDELATRDAEGRDQVVDEAPPAPTGTETDGAASAPDEGGQDAVRPGERVTRLRRYVVTERVVQTIEELPDEDPR